MYQTDASHYFSDLRSLVFNAKLALTQGFINDGRFNENFLMMVPSHMWYWRVHDRCVNILYMRDQGAHSSGWWKNPDYERCYHLSTSIVMWLGGDPCPHDKKLDAEIVQAFWGEDAKKSWCEPPYSARGKAREVWHYRLFANEKWMPIQPKGEVYSKENTPVGWKSFSEIQAEVAG